MSYYWFNRQELLQKANYKYHNCGGKAKAAEYYIGNKDAIKENQKTSIETCRKKKKKKKKICQE